MMSKINIRYFVSIVLGVAILATVLFGYSQFNSFQQEKMVDDKNYYKEIIIQEISIKETKINLLGAGLVSFYENSDNVTTDEFNQYVEKMLDEIPEIKNILYLENDEIVQSYPHDEFINSNFDTVFPTYPIIIDNTKIIAIDYVVDDDKKIVISVPFDFMFDAEPILEDNYKIMLYNPLESGDAVFEYGLINGMKITQPIEFSDQEIESSLRTQKQTDLFGHKINQNYVLDYLIWSEKFEKTIDIFTQLAFLGGVIFAIAVPLFLVRIERYRIQAQKHSEHIENVNKRLIDIDKQKGEFSTMVAHELKTPLVPILGNTDFLKNPKMIDKLEPVQLDAINSIEKNAKRLEALISDLLDVQKIHLRRMKFNKSTFDVKEFMASVRENLSHYMKEKQITFVNTTRDSFELVCDENRLRQVIGNLVKNAVDFVPEAGKIEMGATLSENNALIYVKDNGMGIPQDKQKHLFKKFYQVDTSIKRKHGGTGLGLVICKGIVEGLGGKIWVKSKEGEGTAFYFTIPLVAKKVEVKS